MRRSRAELALDVGLWLLLLVAASLGVWSVYLAFTL